MTFFLTAVHEAAQSQIITIPEPADDWRNEGTTEDSGRVCSSLDIRNSVGNLKKLRGCRVIEGYLQIQLFDNAKEEDFKDISFPELREITGYFLLFRVCTCLRCNARAGFKHEV